MFTRYPNCFSKLRDGLTKHGFLLKNHTQVEMSFDEVGFYGQGLSLKSDCFIVPSLKVKKSPSCSQDDRRQRVKIPSALHLVHRLLHSAHCREIHGVPV